MPTFIYRIQPTRPAMLWEGPTAEEAQIVAEHFAYLQRLYAEGRLILAGRTLNTDYSAFGIAIFIARDDEEMRAMAESDPAVAGRVFRAEWHPFRIALGAPADSSPGD